MIGENIRRMRLLRNLKQSELADLVNVTPQTVSSWEINRTEPKIGVIESICVALHCQKSDIVGGDSAMILTEHERELVIAYRQHQNIQFSVDTLLGIQKGDL